MVVFIIAFDRLSLSFNKCQRLRSRTWRIYVLKSNTSFRVRAGETPETAPDLLENRGAHTLELNIAQNVLNQPLPQLGHLFKQ